MEQIQQATEVAKGVSDYGMLIMTAAFYLVLSALLFIACFRWLKTIIDNMIEKNAAMTAELLTETRKQNDMLSDISEGLRPETQLRVKNTTNAFFDLAVERVCKIIKKVKSENHIVNREATKEKIRTLLVNLHDDRNSRFDSYTFRGQKLSSYTSKEWVDWVAEVVEKEVYDEKPNEGRAYTNVQAVYERIKLDLYHKLNSL
jgi:hypothetical protein